MRTRMMKVRHPLGIIVAKPYRECQPRSKSPTIVMSRVDRQVNWPAQENSYNYFYEDQGGDATENHTPARRRRHRYVQSGIFGSAPRCLHTLSCKSLWLCHRNKSGYNLHVETFQEGFESSEGDWQPFEAHPDSKTGDIRTVRSSETPDRHVQLSLDCPRP